MGSGYRPPAALAEGAVVSRDFCEAKIMGKPLAPRQGAALSAFAFASESGARGRTGFSGSALRAGTGVRLEVV